MSLGRSLAYPLALSTLGWSGSWAIGFSVAFLFDLDLGWCLVGIFGGMTVALALRAAVGKQSLRVLMSISLTWVAANILGGRIVGYNTVTGSVLSGVLGALITASLVVETRTPLRVFSVGLGWLIASLAGANFVSRIGPTLAPALGSLIGTKFGGMVAWLLLWGCGGAITGAIGGWAMFRALRRRAEPSP